MVGADDAADFIDDLEEAVSDVVFAEVVSDAFDFFAFLLFRAGFLTFFVIDSQLTTRTVNCLLPDSAYPAISRKRVASAARD